MNTRIALAVLLAALPLACTEPARRAPEPAQPAAAATAPPVAVGATVYPLKVALRDQDDRPVGLDVGRGHPVLASMFYGSCAMACPLLIARIKRAEAMLPEAARHDTRVLLVSFDPEHDTPEALRGVAAQHGADVTRWTLSTGSDDDVRAVSAVLGIGYRKLPQGGFAHDSTIVALGKDGRVLARVEGDGDLAPLVAAVTREAGG